MSSTASLTEKNVSQFAPVTLVSASPYVVVTNTKLQNIRELIAYAKANPGKLTFGSSGAGAASHLSAELFSPMAKVDMLHVPYKGTGQAVTDLLAGQIDLLYIDARPTLRRVYAQLSEHGDSAKIVAGGQSLVPMMNLRLVSPSILLDIGGN